MICNLFFLILPTVFLLFFQQLHRVPTCIFCVIYVVFAIYFAFVKNEKLPLVFLKKGQNAFIKGNVIVFALILLLMAFPIGGYMNVPLVVPHSQEKADAVLVLASGATFAGDPNLATYQRVLHGARLLKSGQAKHLYISTGFNKITGFNEFYAVASLTQILEIPKDKVTIFKSNEITTTATEALYAKKFFDTKGINKILLTTSNAHIYRSCLTFEKLGFTVLPAPSQNKYTTIYSDNNLSAFRASMHEWIGLVWYYLRGRI